MAKEKIAREKITLEAIDGVFVLAGLHNKVMEGEEGLEDLGITPQAAFDLLTEHFERIEFLACDAVDQGTVESQIHKFAEEIPENEPLVTITVGVYRYLADNTDRWRHKLSN